MAITLNTQQVTINQTYTETVEERTVNISINIPKNQEPIISVTREIVVSHDDEVVSKNVSKIFQITLSDLNAMGKLGIMSEIANIIDTIAPTKQNIGE